MGNWLLIIALWSILTGTKSEVNAFHSLTELGVTEKPVFAENNDTVEVATEEQITESALDFVARTVINEPADSGKYTVDIKDWEYTSEGVLAGTVYNTSAGISYAVVRHEDSEEKGMFRDYFRTIYARSNVTKGEDVRAGKVVADYRISEIMRVGDGGFVVCCGNKNDVSNPCILVKVDKSGNITRVKDLSQDLQAWGNCCITAGTASDEENIYLNISGEEDSHYFSAVVMLDEDFNYKRTLIESINTDFVVGTGKLVYLLDGINGRLSCYDPSTDTLAELDSDIGNCIDIYTAADNELFVETVDFDILSYIPAEGTVTKLFNYAKLGIDPFYLADISRDSSGVIHMVYVPQTGVTVYKLANIVRNGE